MCHEDLVVPPQYVTRSDLNRRLSIICTARRRRAARRARAESVRANLQHLHTHTHTPQALIVTWVMSTLGIVWYANKDDFHFLTFLSSAVAARPASQSSCNPAVPIHNLYFICSVILSLSKMCDWLNLAPDFLTFSFLSWRAIFKSTVLTLISLVLLLRFGFMYARKASYVSWNLTLLTHVHTCIPTLLVT